MVLEIIGWSVTAAAVTWGLTLSWAAVAMASKQEAMQEDIDHWHAEAMRSRQMVIQLKHEAAMWSRGRQNGREDLIAMMPLLVAAQQGLPGAESCDDSPAGR